MVGIRIEGVRKAYGSRAVLDLELADDGRDVDAHAAVGEHESPRDLVRGAALSQELEHLPFTAREPRGNRSRLGDAAPSGLAVVEALDHARHAEEPGVLS